MINKLYHPAYFEYLESKKLPTVTLWTNVCIGDLSRFNTDYHVRTPHLHKAKNFHVQNKTSGQVEGLFSVMKRNPECHKLPLDHFVRHQWDSHKGLQRQFTDGLWEGIAAKESGTITASSAKNICRKQLSTDEEEDFGPEQQTQPIEESWNKQSPRKRAVDRSGVYHPGKTHVSFSSMPSTPSTSSRNDIEKKLAFINFRDSVWFEVAKDSPTVDDCKQSIRRQWNSMAREEQASFIRQEEVENCNEKKCICDKSYRELPTAMVMCDLCKVWYHMDCITVQQAYAEAATFYHCETCVFRNFLPFLRYITHSRRQIQPGNAVELQELHIAWNRKTIREQRTIEELQLPPEINIQVGEQQILSKRGIENPYNASCFMNAVLQVVCGSSLYKFLPTHRNSIKTVRLLNTIHEELCEQTRFPMPFNTSMYELGEELSLNLPQRRQFDGLEFLERIVRKIDEEAKNVTFEDTFFARTAELLICRACGAMKGQLQRPLVFRTRVPEWPEPILLSSLLWDAAACQYSIEDKTPGCTCEIDSKSTPLTSRKDVATMSNLKQGMYYNLIMLLEAPPVLVIETNRVVGAMREGNINRTPIIMEELLELKIATPKTDGHSYTYHLAASINLYAETGAAGAAISAISLIAISFQRLYNVFVHIHLAVLWDLYN